MNMKRILVLVLTFTMLLSTFAPTLGVFAKYIDEYEHEHENGVIDYVSIGDSMTNGIGLMGGYDETDNPDTSNDGNNGFLEVDFNSYPAQFAAWLAGFNEEIGKDQDVYVGDKGTVHLTQLATSAMRVEDFYYILTHGTDKQVDIKDDQFFWTYRELLTNSDRWGNPAAHHNKNLETKDLSAHINHTNKVAGVYQDAIANADVISLASGNSNFGVFLMGRIMNLVGFGDAEELAIDDTHYSYMTLDNAIALLKAELLPDAQFETVVKDAFNNAVESMSGKLPEELVNKVANMVAYTAASYLVYTIKVIDLMLSMNPDATIILVPLMNNGQGFTLELDGTKVDMGDFLAQLYNPLNDLLAVYPAVQQYKGNYKEATFLYASLPEVDGEEVKIETFAQAFEELYAPIVDTNEDGVITDDEYPESRLFCHNRFYGEMQSFVMPIFFSTAGGENSSNPFWGAFNDNDVKAFEIAKKNGTLALAAYATENGANKTMVIAQYLGIVEAVLTAMNSTPSVQSSEIVMPEGKFDMFTLLGPAIGGLTEELPIKIAENASAVEGSMYVDLVDAMVVPQFAPYIADRTLPVMLGLDASLSDLEITLTLMQWAVEDHPLLNANDTTLYLKGELLNADATVKTYVSSLAPLAVLSETMTKELCNVGLLEALLALYGRLKLAWGLSAHPSYAGHDTLAESLIINYNEKGMPAELVLEKMHNLYVLAADSGMISELPVLDVVEEIYEYLDSDEKITDEQTLDIILYTYNKAEDRELTSEDKLEIGRHAYETLMYNDKLNNTGRVAIIGNIYVILETNGYLNSFAAKEVAEELYNTLAEQELINDEQSYKIVDYTYGLIEDGVLTNEEKVEIAKFVYNTLVTGEENVAVVGVVYSVLKAHGYLDSYEALYVVERMYNELTEAGLLNNAQSYAIVDYVYNVIVDEEVTSEELVNVVVFVYKTVVKNETVARQMRMRASTGNTDEEAAKALEIILGIIGEEYLNEENKASLEVLVTGEDALISDALLVKIVDSIVAEVENNNGEVTDALIEQISKTTIEIVLNDPDTDPVTKGQIAGEIANIAKNNGLMPDGEDEEETPVWYKGLDLAQKIYAKLDAKGLLSEKEVLAILQTLYPVLMSPETLTVDDGINLTLAVNEIIFGRDDLTLEQKADILVIVYETLDEEGYITEENAKLILGLIVEYYDEAYFEAYKYADEKGYIDIAADSLDKAIEAIELAIKEVEAGLLGTTDELTREIVKELLAIIPTLREIQKVLYTDSAKDVEGFVAALLELEDDLWTHLNNIYAILRQASIDVNQIWLAPAFYEALRILNEEVIPAVKAVVEAFTEAAIAFMQEKLTDLYMMLYNVSEEVARQAIAALTWAALHVQGKLAEAFATLVDALYDICGDMNEAVLKACELLMGMLNKLDAKLNGAVMAVLDKVAAACAELLKSFYEAYGNVTDAIKAVLNVLDFVIDTVVAVNGKVEDVIAGVLEAYNHIFNTVVNMYNTVEEAIETAKSILCEVVNTVKTVAGKIDATITKIAAAYAALVEKAYEIYGNVEAALNTARAIFNNVVATLERVYANVTEVLAQALEAYASLVETLVGIYGTVEEVFNVAYGIFNEIVDTLVRVNGTLNEVIKNAVDIYNTIITTLANTYANLDNIVRVAMQLFGYLYDFWAETLSPEALMEMFKGLVEIIIEAYGNTRDAYYVVSQIYAYLADLNVEGFRDILDSALEGNYELKDESEYVALGQPTYGEELAGMLNLMDKYNRFDLNGEYAEAVAKADLITIRVSNGEALDFIMSQLENPFDLKPLPWEKHLDAEGQAALRMVLEAVKADLVANGAAEELLKTVGMEGIFETEFVAGVMVYALENTIYAYAEFISRLTTVLDEVTVLSPEATVVLTAVESPAVTMGLDLGEYAVVLDTVVAALNAQLFAAALAYDNVIYVNSNDAEDIYDALNVYCDHVYDNCEDTTCNRCLAVRVAPGHSFGEYVSNNDATCTADGTKTAHCEYCDATDTVADPGSKLEHAWGEWHETKAPTTEECGEESRECSRCDAVETRPGRDPIPVIKDPINWLAIIIGAVVVLAGAGAAVYFFVIKKKAAVPAKKTEEKK